MQNAHVQFAPILPGGALAYTALVLFHRASGNTSKARSRQILFGDRFSSRVNWFGIGAEHLSRHFFGGQVSAHQVLARHTLYGFYSLGLSREMASKWGESLAQGLAQKPTQYVKSGAGPMVSGALRWCANCAALDQASHGFSAWRVAHQLPFIRLCPEHGTPLYVHCDRCGATLDDGRRLKLPGEPCAQCGSVEFASEAVPSGEHYRSLMTRCVDAIKRQDEIYRPVSWRQVMGALYIHAGSVEAAFSLVEARVQEPFASSKRESALLHEMFGPYCHPRYLRQVVLGHLTDSPLIIQVMVLEALDRDGLAIRPRVDQLDWAEAKSQGDPVLLPSVRIHQDHGISDQFVAMVKASSTIKEIARRFEISERHARTLLLRSKGEARSIRQKRSCASPLVNGSSAENTEACRSWVLNVLQSHPKIGRTELWKRCESVVRWLATHDRQWLDERVPSKYPNRSSVRKRLGATQ